MLYNDTLSEDIWSELNNVWTTKEFELKQSSKYNIHHWDKQVTKFHPLESSDKSLKYKHISREVTHCFLEVTISRLKRILFTACANKSILVVYLVSINQPLSTVGFPLLMTREAWRQRVGSCVTESMVYQSQILTIVPRGGGGGTSYVGQYGMLGYTWVIFEIFSVLFPRDGYLFSTKFLYFFWKVGIFFEEKFCICRTRWNPFTRNFLYFIPQSCCILHIKFLYISTWWVSFQEIYCSGWYCSGWNQLKMSCQLSQTLLIDLNNHLLRTGLFTDL